MRPCLELLNHILQMGLSQARRSATGILSVFGHQMRFDLGRGLTRRWNNRSNQCVVEQIESNPDSRRALWPCGADSIGCRSRIVLNEDEHFAFKRTVEQRYNSATSASEPAASVSAPSPAPSPVSFAATDSAETLLSVCRACSR